MDKTHEGADLARISCLCASVFICGTQRKHAKPLPRKAIILRMLVAIPCISYRDAREILKAPEHLAALEGVKPRRSCGRSAALTRWRHRQAGFW
jgi:hypothetical protein